jgi:ribonuclease I
VIAGMRDIMPSKSLIIHEYRVHGPAPASSRRNISVWHGNFTNA